MNTTEHHCRRHQPRATIQQTITKYITCYLFAKMGHRHQGAFGEIEAHIHLTKEILRVHRGETKETGEKGIWEETHIHAQKKEDTN